MADLEVSQFPTRSAQTTDIIPVSRPPFGPGSNYGVTAQSIANLGGSSGPVNINNQTSSYIAALTDANNTLVVMNVGSACTFTVPTNASVAFPIGSTLTIQQINSSGQVTLTPASGAVTINTPSSLTTRANFSTVSLVQIAANVWTAGGDLT